MGNEKETISSPHGFQSSAKRHSKHARTLIMTCWLFSRQSKRIHHCNITWRKFKETHRKHYKNTYPVSPRLLVRVHEIWSFMFSLEYHVSSFPVVSKLNIDPILMTELKHRRRSRILDIWHGWEKVKSDRQCFDSMVTC